MDVLERKVKLVAQNVTKTLGKRRVLSDVSFEVMEGEFLAILGESGCGKTTLLRILIGLDAPDSGEVWKEKLNITKTAPSERGMGIVFQNYALFEHMTVLQNVEYALKKINKMNSKKLAEKFLMQVGLLQHVNKKPKELSGGQQQRVAIARTLALTPDIILFDEPMSALDANTRVMLRNIIKDIQNNLSATIIYITHDQEEAFALADRIMVMSENGIEQIGEPNEIIQNPRTRYVQEFVINNLEAKFHSMQKYIGETK